MEIKRLQHLVALADCLNFGRAAEQCHLSQSAFSRSIQAAEEELGLQLFDRGSIEARCTPAGAFVVERARKLLFENRCLERDIRFYRERQIGDLAFGSGPFPAATLLPELMVALRTQFPGVKLRVEVNNADYLLQHLRAETLDFYLADLRNIPAAPDLEMLPIGLLPAGFYVRQAHPLLSKEAVTGADLLACGLASVRLPEAMLLFLAQFSGMAEGSRFPLALECDDLALLKAVVLQSDTVLACPQNWAGDGSASGSLQRLEVAGFPSLGANLGIVSLKGRSLSLMARFAVDSLRRQVGQAGPAVTAGS